MTASRGGKSGGNSNTTRSTPRTGRDSAGQSIAKLPAPKTAIVHARSGALDLSSEIHHHEIFLAHIAQRAAPVRRDVGEARAGRDAFVGQAFLFVVDPSADQADPALVFDDFAHDDDRKIVRKQ